MKRRTLALVMTLVMVLNCFGGVTAFAVNADGHNVDHTGWTAVSLNGGDGTTAISACGSSISGHWYFNQNGKYYLTEDIALSITVYVYPNDTMSLDLNGYNLSSSSGDKTVLNIKSGATLNLYGTGTDLTYWKLDDSNVAQISTEAEYDFTTTGGAITNGLANAVGGGGVFIQQNAILNMYGGNIVGNICNNSGRMGGGVYNYCGTVNMYGGTIAGNAATVAISGGVYNRAGSAFNMYGGSIAYNYSATYGAGMYNAGTFNMSGGSIEYNTAVIGGGGVSTISTMNLSGDAIISNNNSDFRCGGVFIASNGTLNMSGGSITNNTSGSGGEAGVGVVYATSTLNMSGGEISGNTTTGASAGVGYTNGTFTLSGTAVIKDNAVVDSNGEEIKESNAYLSNGNVIEVTAAFTGRVGITTATGVGTVVVTGDYADNNDFTSDAEKYYPVQVDDTVELQAVAFTDGTDKTVDYAQGTIDVSDMFDFTGITSEPVYTVTGVTGEGTLSGRNLSVSKVGEFTVTAYTAHCDTAPPTTQTATLIVEPITVDITGIATVGNVVNGMVEIDNTKGTLTGVVNGDAVSIDYTVAYGSFTKNDYSGSAGTYDVTIHDISLTGDDTGNYELGTVNEGNGTTVTITTTTPYISWPTASDLTYGDTRDNDNLIGGQVVIKVSDGTATYTDITGAGHFEWVTIENEDAGTHTYEVKFVLDSNSQYYSDYNSLVSEVTHNVTQVVNMAEVGFTITGNVGTSSSGLSITAKDADGSAVDAGDYRIYYATYNAETGSYDWNMDWDATQTTPTAVGSYLIATDFTANSTITPNYVHAGTMESYAKQVGSMVIWESDEDDETKDEPTTYSTIFRTTAENGDEISGATDFTGALDEDIHILPTVSDYSAWQTTWEGVTTTYDFGARFPQPDHDVVFTPVAALATGDVTGTINGTDLDGQTGDLSGVVVALIQGAEQVSITETDASGNYEFEAMPQGRYDLVVTRDYVIRNEETVYINLNDASLEVDDITLPDTRQNTIFNVAAGMAAITVEGMKELITGTATIRSIKLELNTATVADTQDILATAATEGLSADNCKYFIDLSILERTEGATGYGEIASLDEEELLTFYIPLAGIYQGYENYILYQDDGSVAKMSSTVNANSEYATVSEDGSLLTLHIQKSGIYGLAFYDDPDQVLSAETKTTTYTADPIDINEIFSTIESDGTRSYVIQEITGGGEGTIDSSTGMLTVTKCGTFKILVRIAGTSEYKSMTGLGTLIVNPAPVTISGITCVDRGVDDGSLYVEINTGGLLTGVDTSDEVYINYDTAYGLINDSDFDEDDTLNATGANIFGVSVVSLDLTGDDADNYTLASNTVASTVNVNMSIPYIAWPTATSVVFGNENSHDDLYGGKVVVFETASSELNEYGDEVVVYEGGAYTDITSYGEFQWVETVLEADAGTYEYEVKFVLDTNAITYDGEASYIATLNSTTHLVTQVVEPAAVTFTVADSTLDAADSETPTVTATDENGNELSETDDYILYYATYTYDESEETWSYVWDWDGDEPDFTGSGTYLIGAELLSANYHHAGDTVITAKQIGAVTVYNSETEIEPATYTTTFMIGDTEYKVFEGAIADTIHILPDLNAELDTDSYTGWYCKETDVTYDLGERFTQGDTNKTLTAVVAADKSATISGVITGDAVGTEQNDTLGGIAVALYQGNTLVGTYTTGTDGAYTFAVASGVYNLVVTRDYNGTKYETTVFVDVTQEDSASDIELSTNVVQNAILEVDKGLPDVVVTGLTTLAEEGTDGSTQASEVKLEVTASTTSDLADIEKIRAYATDLTNDELKQFFNIDISSKTGAATSYTAITKLDDCLTFYIPLTGVYAGHDEYYVYRYHEGEVQEISEKIDGDDTQEEYFRVTDSYLILSAKYFSLYGFGFVDNDDATTTTPSTSSTSTGSSTYSSSVASATNGSVSVSANKSTSGSIVTITTNPDDGYKVGTVTVTYASGREVTVTDKGDGTYTYLQPGASVTVSVTYVSIDGTETNVDDAADTGSDDWMFTDVDTDHWFYDAVAWAVDAGVTSGKTATTFDPYGINNRAEAATFLWRTLGEPAYTIDNPFTDTVAGSFYYDAVLWAMENGVTLGTTATTYSPYMDCSRAHIITFLWRMLGKPIVDSENPFADVNENNYYYDAVLWAVDAGITNGTTATTFSPDQDCSRAEIVTFLYRSVKQ